jgi:hypothetical protein
MPRRTPEEQEEYLDMIKKTVKAMDGHVSNSAAALGISVSRLSTMLNHRGLVEWWVPYREALSRDRRKARNRRSHEKRRRRELEAQGLDPDLYFHPRKRS